jgi:RND family efflux transporter MFP subunit
MNRRSRAVARASVSHGLVARSLHRAGALALPFACIVAALVAPGAASAQAAPTAAQPVEVRVVQPTRRDFARETTQPATAEAFYEADLGAKISGHVSDLRVDIGTVVKTGQMLAQIDVPELTQARNAASAEVKAQRSAYERTVELAQRNSITQRAVTEAQDRLDTAIAREAEAQAQLEYTKILAPFDGVVTLRTIDPGDMVYQASSPKGKAEPLLRVAKLDVIRVRTYVPERDSIWVDVGDAATVTFEALPGRTFAAPIARVSGVLDPATRTMLVEIDLKNDGRVIRPGSYGQARIALARHEHALALPASAVALGEGDAHVFVVAGDTVSRRDVGIGLADSQWTEITSGLAESDRVVAAATAAGLADGARVRVLAQ